MKSTTHWRYLLVFIITLSFSKIYAQSDADELAKQLQNPIASLISVPFQGNMDFGIGEDDGTRFTLNIQPVIPLSIGENWNLVTRVVLPVISQSIDESSYTGIGNTVASGFFSPKAPTKGGLIWGAGPVLILPATHHLGSQQFE